MFYYSLSLHNASFIMVNSSWTRNHVNAVLDYAASDIFLSTVHSINVMFAGGLLTVLRTEKVTHRPIQIAYPSCHTKQMSAFPLTERERIILSLAQFRYDLRKC
jgi:alpha-1,2-mannosyltransferase